MIDCGYFRCEFYFRIKEKEKDTFYFNFYSIIFSKVVFYFVSHYFNQIIIMDICVQFIIVSFYDKLITNKVL